MRTSITKIGNSKGIIIPAHILKSCGFDDEIMLEQKGRSVLLSKAEKPRAGWNQAFANARIDAETIADFANDFDDNDWTW